VADYRFIDVVSVRLRQVVSENGERRGQADEVDKGIWDEISTIIINKPVNKREESFFSELILLHF